MTSLLVELVRKNFRFGFEGFVSLIEKGRWEVDSNETLKSMFVWPDNPKTWTIGDGYFSNPVNTDFYYTGSIPDDENNRNVQVDYPGGKSVSFIADVRYFMLAAAPGEPLKYRASCVVTDWGSGDGGE